MKLGQKIIT